MTGIAMGSFKLSLLTWFLALYLTRGVKTGQSLLALIRPRDTNYGATWYARLKVMAAVWEYDAQHSLGSRVRINGTYLGG